MSNLKTNLYPKDVDFTKITSGMKSATEAMKAYAELDMKATMFMFKRLQKHFYPKVKHTSDLRTNSARKWAGRKNNKPKYNWGKKRRRQGGWKA